MDLVKFLEKKSKTILVVAVTLKVSLCRTVSKKKSEKKWKTEIIWAKQTSFLAPYPSTLGQF
jgi:hypothetical protein